MPISVLLVDDNADFREGVHIFLKANSDFDIVGEAVDGLDALVMAEHLHPDVVVLDCQMPHMSGVEIARGLRQQRPGMHVVMLSIHEDEAYVLAAIQNGASGYILKEDTAFHLAKAVTAAAAGKYYFSPSLRDLAELSEMINPSGNVRRKPNG